MELIRTTGDFICPRCGIHTSLCFFTTGQTKAHCLKCGEYYDVEIASITNANRLRAMTDEELAEYLAERSTAPTCTGKCQKDYEVYGELRTFCHDCWLDWLKQEVRE